MHRSGPRAPQLIVSLVVAACVASVACTDAGGHVTGGDLKFDASTSTVDAGPDPDIGLGTGTTFTDLYNDYFGPMGRAKCSGNGACHGSSSQPGAVASGGYICPDTGGDAGTNGTIKAQCRASMISSGIITPGMPFDQSYMHNVIRKATKTAGDENNMPRTPFTYTFSDTSVARINAWVMGGAPDN
jgi:hypothetical protein